MIITHSGIRSTLNIPGTMVGRLKNALGLELCVLLPLGEKM